MRSEDVERVAVEVEGMRAVIKVVDYKVNSGVSGNGRD